MRHLLRLLATPALLVALFTDPSRGEESARPRNLHAELNPPAVPGVSVRKLTATTAEVEWPANLSAADQFRVEVRRLFLGENRELQMEWVNFPHATIARSGEDYRARLTDLTPRQPYWVRVLSRNQGGGASDALFAVRFQTPEKTLIFSWRRGLTALLSLTLAVLVWLRWRQRAR